VIGKLAGTVDSRGDGWVVVDVGGVGYHVHGSGRTLAALPGTGKPVKLWVDTLVRDDRIQLFGFADAGERDWFRLLQTVQGVGPRVALAILSVLAPAELAQAVLASDRALVSRANGVGPKLAQRICAELKDKVGGVTLGVGAVSQPVEGHEADAVSVLVNLGYGRAESFAAVAGASRALGGRPSVEVLVRAGLRELAR
jgi:Holliday junction DNA helicase RuvA